MKTNWYYGVDFGTKSDFSAEIYLQRNPDNSFTVIDMHTFKKTIDLPKDAYRVKNATAPAQ